MEQLRELGKIVLSGILLIIVVLSWTIVGIAKWSCWQRERGPP